MGGAPNLGGGTLRLFLGGREKGEKWGVFPEVEWSEVLGLMGVWMGWDGMVRGGRCLPNRGLKRGLGQDCASPLLQMRVPPA